MALILARKVDEGVVLRDGTGKQIARVFVARIVEGGYQVKLGFEAGPEIAILRDELAEGDLNRSKQREQRSEDWAPNGDGPSPIRKGR